MSSSLDTGDTVSVSDGDISVTKRYEPDEFPVPAIRFEITSERDEPVSIRLTESIPESFPMDSVGFHPKYHSDQWTAYQDHRVQFSGVVEPDSPLVTVYGIRHDEEFDPSSFLTEPSITSIPADGSGESTTSNLSTSVDEIVSSGRNGSVKDMLAGNRESIPGLDSDSTDSGDSEPSDSDEAEPDIELDIDAAAERVAAQNESVDESRSSVTSEEGFSSTRRERERVDSESVVRSTDEQGRESPLGTDSPQSDVAIAPQLAAEIRSGSVDDSDLRTIYGALGADDASGTTQAKLAHLQERVDDLAAYTGALEEFLEEEGTGVHLIEGFRAELDQLRSDLSAVARVVEDHDSTLTTLDERVSSVESSVTELEDRTDSI